MIFKRNVSPCKRERIQLSLKLDWVLFPPQIIAHFATCKFCPQTSFPFCSLNQPAVANPKKLAHQTEYKEGRGENILQGEESSYRTLEKHSSIVTFSVDKNVFETFKQTANKDMRKYSQIVEGAMRRYVSSKI